MSSKTRLVLRILWIVFGLLAIAGGAYLAVCGFSGTLSPAFGGFGWLLATLWLCLNVLGDIGRAVEQAVFDRVRNDIRRQLEELKKNPRTPDGPTGSDN